jgi:hypothetical protein
MKHCTESLHRLLIDDQIAKLKEQTMGTKQWGHQTMTKQWGQIYLSHHEPVNSPTIAQYKNKSVPFISYYFISNAYTLHYPKQIITLYSIVEPAHLSVGCHTAQCVPRSVHAQAD